MPSLISNAQKVYFDQWMDNQFDTFKRPFDIYIEAQTAVISTSPTFSRFGGHGQNAAITAANPAVIPQFTTVEGCILYGNKQPWVYMNPDSAASKRDAQQLKIREANGIVRIKVAIDGYTIMQGCKLVRLDGFNFQLDSTVRPHGLIGAPTRWTYTLERQL